LYAHPLPPSVTVPVAVHASRPFGNSPQTMLPIWIAAEQPRIVWLAWAEMWALPVWSLGVLILSVRLAGGGRYAFTLERRGQSADESVLTIVARVSRRMGLHRSLRVVTSEATDGPSVLGWLRPVILLPPAAIMGLSPEQLEAILAHEIAHIMRYDGLVNMF